MDVSAGEEQQHMLYSKAFDTPPQYPVIITGGIGAGLMDDKVGGKLSGIPGVVISRIKSTLRISQGLVVRDHPMSLLMIWSMGWSSHCQSWDQESSSMQ